VKAASRARAGIRAVRSSPTGLVAVGIIAIMAILAVIGPVVWGTAASRIDVVSAFAGPSAHHPFGTDRLGENIFLRVLAASRTSLSLAALAAAIGLGIGIPLGAIPSVMGRRVQRAAAAVINGLIAFPGILLALFVNTVIGVGAAGAVIGLGTALVPTFARLAQTMSAKVAGLDYVTAARLVGVGRARLVRRHILPNVAEPLLITGAMSLGWSLLGLSALSFLGLGVRPPGYDWGSLLADGLTYVYENPLAALGPGLFIVVASLGFNLLGESISAIASGAAGDRQKRAVSRGRRPVTGEAEPSDGRPVPAEPGASPVLKVADLSVTFNTRSGSFTPVKNVSFDVREGEILGLVGESGSGKTMTALALCQLVPYPGVTRYGELAICGKDIRTVPRTEVQHYLGSGMAMVFQDPTNSLNPALRIGTQMAEVAQVHAGTSKAGGLARAAKRLSSVQIASPEFRLAQYPHQLSGGMRQRVAIAMSLMADAKVIIADEPTTALDVSVQHEILRLLRRVNEESGAAILFISHDLAVIASLCDRVLVMYAGQLVEELAASRLQTGPSHPYTRALLRCVPTMSTDRSRPLPAIGGNPPRGDGISTGCPFAPRCERADSRCRQENPVLTGQQGSDRVACWHPYTAADELVSSPG
jgi:peptide/nickel transport system permease protein